MEHHHQQNRLCTSPIRYPQQEPERRRQPFLYIYKFMMENQQENPKKTKNTSDVNGKLAKSL